MDDPLLGSVLAGYRIVRRVGRGGMGVVYEAVDLTLDRAVALKLIAPERAAAPEYRERFATEARLAASIEHPHVVPVFGAGEENGQLFLAMRFVAGDDLGTVVARDGPLVPERSARILMQVASALEAVHQRGLVHRDVKPANVLLGPDDQAFLTDFGVAKQPFADGHTAAGALVGTPDYVAPEQIRGEPLGPHTDVYALGGLLFFTLTGHVVFPLEHTEGKLWAHLREPPPVAPAFDAIVRTALAKDPRERYPSAAAFEQALRAAARGEAADRVEVARRTWREAESDLTALALQREPEPTTSTHGICPFKGLATFEFDDASYFFGRERIVAELVARLVGAPLLAIVGASGSGKSSLLRAGLLPALAAGVLPGSERWSQALLRPGAHPLAELERVGEPVVLAVDQFEETFTACRSEQERAAFVDALTRRNEGVVIIAVRGDYYERCALYPALSLAMASNQVLVAPMRRDELRQAIERPAQRAGLRAEPELVDTLLDDVEAEPGGLPLLSTALLELWQHRRGEVLQLATYERTGGVRRAVARLAEEAFEQLDESDQDLARRLLLRLAGEGAGEAVVRRRVSLDELDEDQQRVAALLAQRRLLTVSAGSVEVAHEALLREWPRLRGWLEQDAEGRRLHRRLSDAAREWDERGRDPGDLYRAARLAAALEWQGTHERELGATERAFLAAARDAEAQELALAKRRTRRLRVLAGGLAVLAVIAGLSAILAVRQSARVEAERRTAVSRGLAAQAVAKLEEAPDLAALLSLEAYRIEPTLEARAAVLGALPRLTPQTGVLRGHSGYVAGLQFRRDGRMLVSGGEDGTARVWDTRTRRQVHVLRPVELGTPVTGLAYDPGGSRLAVSVQAGTFSLWDLRGPPHVGAPQGGYERTISTVAFSPRGDRFAAGTFLGTVRFWDPRTQRELPGRTAAPTDAPVSALAFAAEGRTLIVGTEDGAVRRWDPSTGRPLGPALVGRGGRINGLAFSARGEWLAAAVSDGTVRIWDTRSWQPGQRLEPGVGAVHAVAFAPRGTTLAVAGEDGTLRRWDPRSGLPIGEPLVGHTGPVTGVAYSPEGTLASAGADGTIRLWAPDAGDAPLDSHSGPVSSLDFSADGRRLVSGSKDSAVQVWDVAARRPDGPALVSSGAVSGVAFGERGVLVISTARGALEFWEGGRRLGAPRDADVGAIGALAALGNRLRVAGTTSVATWDVTAQRESEPLISGHGSDRITDVAADPTGRLLATASGDWTVRLWDTSRHQPHGAPLAGHTLAVRAVTFSADGKTVATAGEDGTVRLWDTETTQPRGQPLLGHRTAVTGVAFNRAGTTLASADDAGGVRLWDVATRRQLGRPLAGHGEGVATVKFSPDGRLLASAGADGKVRLWPSILWSSDLRAFLRHVCAVVGRSLTRAEWREYLPDQAYRETCP